jgi:hypothetical protein
MLIKLVFIFKILSLGWLKQMAISDVLQFPSQIDPKGQRLHALAERRRAKKTRRGAG